MRKRSRQSWEKPAPFTWRDYQRHLKRRNGEHFRRGGRRLLLTVLLLAVLGGLYALLRGTPAPSAVAKPEVSRPAAAPSGMISKEEVRQLLDKKEFNNLTTRQLALTDKGQVLHVETSLDVGLQKYLLRRMDRKNSRYIGLVVMEAKTGRVLAMAGFDRDGKSINPCLCSKFPSASIFKIVTAASAVDHCGFTPNSPMHFNGDRYTLYKRQLKNRTNRYTNTVSFKQAFAQSVDPVFGKIGEHHLGKPVLQKYADAFGFNEPLNFDIPIQPSHFQINDKPYHWAELASGFNRETTISPLHGAVMASAVLNGGRMVTPSIVDRIVDDQGKVLFRWQQAWEQRAMSARAAGVLNQLMQATVKSGTAHRFFRDYRRDRILSRLVIGGKTGTIDNRAHDTRYDWFVGFARERHGNRQVVVAAMVAHGKYIGTRSCQYARMAMRYYFREKPGGDAFSATR